MSLPSIFFKDLLMKLAGQFIDNGQEFAECIGDDFGSRISQNAKDYFSISLIECKLQRNRAKCPVKNDPLKCAL